MTGAATIGALRVTLGADTAALEKGLKDAQSGLASFSAAVGTGMAAVATAVVAAGAAIGVALGNTIKDMDKLNKTSQKLGIPVEQLSALAYAADLSDVSFEALSKSVGKLSKNMVEAASKPTSEAASAFKALGVSVVDSNGKLKSSQDVMGAIADKFEGLKDGAGKTAVSMAIFGKAGADLIPLLNGGRDSLKEMNEEAAQFGAIVSGNSAKQAEAFNDNMTRLGYAVKGVVVQVAERLLPILVDISNKMVESAKNSGAMAATIDVLSTAMKGLVTAGVLVGATLQIAADTLSIIWGGLAKLIKGDVSGAFEHLKAKSADISTIAITALGTLNDVWGVAKTGAEGAAASTDKATKAQKDFNYAALGGKNAVDSFLDSQNKSIAGQQAEFAATGMAAGAKERLRVVMQGLAVAQANGIVMTDAMRIKLTQTANAAELVALKMANWALIGESNPLAAIGLQIDATNAKLASGSLEAKDYAELSGQAAQLTAKLWQDSAASLGGSFEAIGSSLSQLGDSWASFAKWGQALGASVAFVNSYVAASEAFAKTPFPGNIAIAAGVLAKGMGMVAAIKSAAVPKGFAAGGFVSGMGTGVSDSIPAMLSNGEFVMNAEATERFRPQLEAMNRGSGGAAVTVNVAGLGRDSYSRDEVVRMMEGINDALGDGYRLRTV